MHPNLHNPNSTCSVITNNNSARENENVEEKREPTEGTTESVVSGGIPVEDVPKPKKPKVRFDQITAEIAATISWDQMMMLSPEQTNEMCLRWHSGELSPENVQTYVEALHAERIANEACA